MHDYAVLTYGLYAAITIPLTLFVARTLSRNGSHFLVDVFGGNEALAKAVNQLLVVGFYLLNFGFVAVFLKSQSPIDTTRAAFEELSTKVGIASIATGVVHFGNVWTFNKYRNRAIDRSQPPLPPVSPDTMTMITY